MLKANNYFKVWWKMPGLSKVHQQLFFFNDNDVSEVEEAYYSANTARQKIQTSLSQAIDSRVSQISAWNSFPGMALCIGVING